MKNKKTNFLKQIKAKQSVIKTLTVFMLIFVAMFSAVIVIIPTTLADEGTVSITGYLNYDIRGAVSVFYNSSIYTFGGYDTGYANIISRYIPSTNATTDIGDIPVDLYAFGTVFDDTNIHLTSDCVWLLGGTNGAGDRDSIYCFTFDNETCWNTGHTLVRDTVNTGGKGVIDSNGVIYVFGGTASGPTYHTEIQAYNYSNGTSWDYDILSSARNSYTSAYSKTSGEYYMLGGKTVGVKVTTMTVYSFSNNTDWTCGNMDTNNIGPMTSCWNDQNNTILTLGGNDGTNPMTKISEINCTTYVYRIINNLSEVRDYNGVVWGHNATKYFAYTVAGRIAGGAITRKVEQIDLGLSYSSEDASSYSIKGLTSSKVTWSGTGGTTVWCNSSGDGNEWPEINMTVNTSDNVTEFHVWMDDLNDTSAYINASNITMYVSSDNSSYGEMGTFTDGGSNCSSHITNANWNVGTMGSNPFSGAGITDGSFEIYLVFKLTIPVDSPTDIFWSAASNSFKIYIGTV